MQRTMSTYPRPGFKTILYYNFEFGGNPFSLVPSQLLGEKKPWTSDNPCEETTVWAGAY
jgi:hypothetical protein